MNWNNNFGFFWILLWKNVAAQDTAVNNSLVLDSTGNTSTVQIFSNGTCSDVATSNYAFNQCQPSRNAALGVVRFYCDGPTFVRQQFNNTNDCNANRNIQSIGVAEGVGCRQFTTNLNTTISWVIQHCPGATPIPTNPGRPVKTPISINPPKTSPTESELQNSDSLITITVAIIVVCLLASGLGLYYVVRRNYQNTKSESVPVIVSLDTMNNDSTRTVDEESNSSLWKPASKRTSEPVFL
ncbi:hypothetical protein BC833DRAFT_600714 [Globomyces pollinis-pini]|nr:hypothetical protein BC833DRAFT_600714 [Globomyces pollinis-pini]